MLTDLDYELLSAYLDGALTESERTALESRLRDDRELRQELDALRATVQLVNQLPLRKAPRDFTLTAAMVRPTAPRWLIFPASAAFSALSAAAAVILIAVSAVLLVSNSSTPPNAMSLQSNQVAVQFTAVVDQQTASKLPATAAVVPTESQPGVVDVMPSGGSGTGDGLNADAASTENTEVFMFSAPVGATMLPQPTLSDLAFESAPALANAPSEADAADSAAVAQSPLTEAATSQQAEDNAGSAASMMMPVGTPTPAATLLPSSTQQPPPAPLDSTGLDRSSATEVAQVVIATPTMTPTATPPPTATAPILPQPAPASAPSDLLPLILIGLAGVLLLLALGTTLVRRRAGR